MELFFFKLLFIASVSVSTLDKIDGMLIVFSSEAEFPTGLLGSALLLAFLNDFGTIFITLTFVVFVGALFFHTLFRVSDRSNDCDFVDAVVFDDTIEEVDRNLISRFIEADIPAGDVILALLTARVKYDDTVRVKGAQIGLSEAVLLDAFFRGVEGSEGILNLSRASLLFVASVGVSALDEVNGMLIVLSSEAELPTGLLGSTLLLAFLNDLGTIFITFTFVEFVGAFLLHALFGVIDSGDDCDFVEAVVFQDTVPEVDGRLISRFTEAASPAGDIVLALFTASIKSDDTVSVKSALSGLSGAVLLNAIFRGVEDSEGAFDLSSDFVEAVVFQDTAPEVDGRLISRLTEAGSPAGDIVLALFTAGVKSDDTVSVKSALSGLIRAVLLNAVFRGVEDSKGGLDGGFFDFVEAVVVDDAFPENASGFIAFLGDASGPASLVIFAVILTRSKDSDAVGVFGAGSGLVGAVLSNAILRIEQRDGFFSNLNSVGAVMLENASDVVSGIRVFCSFKALFPTCNCSIASIITEFQGSNTSTIVFAEFFLFLAVFFNAILRVVEEHGKSLFVATISMSAFGGVDGSLTTFSTETEFPACLLSAAFTVAIIKSRLAFRIFLTSSPLVRAFLLNTGEGVGNDLTHHCEG